MPLIKNSIVIIFAAILASCSGAKDPASYVNMFNGTDLAGNSYPGATVPFGAVQLGPDTSPNRTSGYHYSDTVIVGFSHTHLYGTGCPDFGDFLFTPTLNGTVGPLEFSHKDEYARPGYYRVDFPVGITAEMTADVHTGVHRYTFNGKGVPQIQVDAEYCIGWWSKANVAVLEQDGPQGLKGKRNTTAWAHGRDIYFSAEFSVPFEKVESTGRGKLLLTFPEGTKIVTVYAGLSGVSVENARNNRMAETSDLTFEDVVDKATTKWDEALGSIKVKNGPKDVFYTYFYHTFTSPNRLDDVDGSYRDESGRDRKTDPGRKFYSTLSLWDTFRSWHPLQTILDPALGGDIIYSMLDMYDCSGELPVWPLASFETACMTGYHSVSVIADAWLKGIRSFDGEKALWAMVRSSNVNEAGTSSLYNGHGYVPADLKAETVSKTLEYAYDDWCIARMAEDLGHNDIAGEYYDRSLRYRELFDPVTGFMRAKKADGSWTEPFDPLKGSRDYVEATPWQYRFFVPHDIAGLEAMMGGRERMLSAVDSLFNYRPEGQESVDRDIRGILGQYAQGNEPDHNFPWLFNYIGEPSKSQEVVRWLLLNTYHSGPDGISGNEDCGQMSAWYILASLGIYPACPGTGEFVFSAPLFKEAEIRLGNGNTLIIKADHPKRPFISEVTLNGRPVTRNFLTYDEIMGGGTLAFKLSSKPDHGRDNLTAPYSLTTDPVVSKPFIEGDLHLFQEEAVIRMGSRTEGAVVRYTLDGSEPLEDSPEYTGPFKVDKSLMIRAKAFKDGFRPSPEAFRAAHKVYYCPVADMAGMKPGCLFTYHTANFVSVGQIDGDPEEDWGVMSEPSLKDVPVEDHFAYCFSGYIDIPEDGTWFFSVTSDDGSELWIHGDKVVANDGSHKATTASGSIPLQKGPHPFRLLYFDFDGDHSLSWAWKREGDARFVPVPANRLYYR